MLIMVIHCTYNKITLIWYQPFKINNINFTSKFITTVDDMVGAVATISIKRTLIIYLISILRTSLIQASFFIIYCT